VGDSLLASFRFDRFDTPRDGCWAAAGAACMAADGMAALNEARRLEGLEPLGFGVGLHPGEVTFGNIGTPTRLEFTVIGPTANEAARVADQCRDTGEEIVVSDAFRDLAGGAWRPLGDFVLRNVQRQVALFAPT